ncbi:hypothetical protein LJR175_004397 [Variovorax sp. LjRoot175]|uniref:hypothetical protein n=1 Tax=Variovorax sp. LjRoot175 TaxID=3342276 RepID=UPI003ECC7675
MRALAEMIGCATQSQWGRFPKEFTPAELQAGADGVEAFRDCVDLYRAKHAITVREMAEALADFRAMNGDAPAKFADGVLRHLVVDEAPAPSTPKTEAAARHAEALREQTAALAIVRATNERIKAWRKARAEDGAKMPANQHELTALVVRQVAEKAVLHAANDAVRAAKAGIREAAIAERRARP